MEAYVLGWLGRILASRYQLLKLLGSGGFGAVFAAHDQVLDRPVAIKVLSPERPGSDHGLRFQREARLLARLRHPNIVSVLDFGSDEGLLFLVMELVEGIQLERLVTTAGPLPALRVVQLADQILQALAEAHRQNIVHRDLKPENVLVVSQPDLSDRVKLVDFGTATLLGPTDIFRTEEGYFYGTPAFMSPEQGQGQPLDGRSDLYAFGCVLYYILCGQPPFVAPGPLEVLVAHATQEPVPPSTRARRGWHIPIGLEQLALWCMAKRPDARPASAEALRVELHQVAQGGFLPPRLTPVLRRGPESEGTPRAGEAVEKLALELGVVTWQEIRLKGVLEQLQQLGVTVQLWPVLGKEPSEAQQHCAVFLLDEGDPQLRVWTESLSRWHVPFLICGDAALLEAMTRAVELGAYDYLALPVKTAALRRMLSRAAKSRRH